MSPETGTQDFEWFLLNFYGCRVFEKEKENGSNVN